MTTKHSEEHIVQTLAEAEQLKKEGNDFFAQQNYKQALKKYKYMALYLNGLDSNFQNAFSSNLSNGADNEAKSSFLKELEQKFGKDSLKYKLACIKHSSVNNQSICYLKLNMPEKAVKCANQALAIDPDNVKTKMRRFQGCIEIGDVVTASQDLHDISQEIMDEKIINQLQRQLDVANKKQHLKEKQLYSKMFSSMK